MARRLGATALLIAIAACAAPGPRDAPGDVMPPAGLAAIAPDARFDALERDLLAAASFRLVFAIRSEGLIESDLRGDYRQGPGAHRRLDVEGLFDGREVRLGLLVETPGSLVLGADGDWLTMTAPPALDEAVLLGLTRMGILHNLARLTGRLPPEGSDGSFPRNASCLCFEERAGHDLAFKIFWGGDFVADAELRFDPAGRPRERVQTAHFPGGDMRVVETYEVFAID